MCIRDRRYAMDAHHRRFPRARLSDTAPCRRLSVAFLGYRGKTALPTRNQPEDGLWSSVSPALRAHRRPTRAEADAGPAEVWCKLAPTAGDNGNNTMQPGRENGNDDRDLMSEHFAQAMAVGGGRLVGTFERADVGLREIQPGAKCPGVKFPGEVARRRSSVTSHR